MKVVVHSLAPTGHTGGRAYLRMLQHLTSEEITRRTVPDFKRTDQPPLAHYAAPARHRYALGVDMHPVRWVTVNRDQRSGN